MTDAQTQIIQRLDQILAAAGGGSGAAWGDITGTLSNQTDLQTQLDGKASLAQAMPYLVYTALLTQTATDAPVATVLQNTLGGTVVWSYVAEGSYQGALNSGFPENKTAILTSNVSATDLRYTTAAWNSADAVFVKTARPDAGLVDGVLNVTPIEIRVYP